MSPPRFGEGVISMVWKGQFGYEYSLDLGNVRTLVYIDWACSRVLLIALYSLIDGCRVPFAPFSHHKVPSTYWPLQSVQIS